MYGLLDSYAADAPDQPYQPRVMNTTQYQAQPSADMRMQPMKPPQMPGMPSALRGAISGAGQQLFNASSPGGGGVNIGTMAGMAAPVLQALQAKRQGMGAMGGNKWANAGISLLGLLGS